VNARPVIGDPLGANLRDGASVGLLAIDLGTRRRMKAKGKVMSMTGDGFEVRTERVYALCPKYIQARTRELGRRDRPARDTERAPTLTGEQGEWISRADTFFVASFHPETTADASHRGGMPGFVRVVDGGTLVSPAPSARSSFGWARSWRRPERAR
jgi:hypothetical protein